MTWDEWMDGRGSMNQWTSASEGLSEIFATPARKIERAHRYQTSGALWVEVREPLEGIRLVAFSMARQLNAQGVISLRVWTSDALEGIYSHFDRGPKFELQGHSWARYTNAFPQGNWEKQLQEKGVTLSGVRYSGNLSNVGSADDGEAVLRKVFRSFCEFVLERYEKAPMSSELEETAGPSPTDPAATQEEREISELLDGLVDLADSERDAMVKARIGQSKFRDRLLNRWGGACSVTGLKSADLLIASHIVPWSRCTTANARWDVNNGLMLTPGLDKAFELGYIGFQHEGKNRGRIVMSPKAHFDIRRRLGFDDAQLRLRDWDEGLAPYLENHRTRWQLSTS